LSRVRVALETQFSVGTSTGLGHYASALAQALQLRDDVEVVALCDRSLDPWRFDRRVLWDQVRAPRQAARAGAHVVHFTGGTLPIWMPRPVVLTLHDLAWSHGRPRGRFYARWYFGRLQPSLARRADAIVADTNAAALDIAATLGIDRARILVAGAAVDERFFCVARRPQAPPFALVVGTVEARKDLATAVRAVARIDGLQLIAAGPLTPYVREVRAAIEACGVADRVRLLGYVDDATLLDLYARAALIIQPSRYEGFGLPPLQALACGLPVVAARIGVTEEVLGDGAWYVPPGDDKAFAETMRAVLSGGAAVRERTAAGAARAAAFSWSAVASKMAELYHRLAR
jgi:glycosyltransferase involved in cell wall biosynthesis